VLGKPRVVAAITVTLVLAIGMSTVTILWHHMLQSNRSDLPTYDGITAPDRSCVRAVEHEDNPWVTSGRWAGYVNGHPEVLTVREVTAHTMRLHYMRGVWLCPP
jgi:hypothetical protein